MFHLNRFKQIVDDFSCAFCMFDLVYIFCLLQNQESDAAKAFIEVAGSNDEIPFAITSADDVIADSKVNGDAVVVFKNVSVDFMLWYIIR